MIKIGYQDPIWGPVFKSAIKKGLQGLELQWVEADDLSLAGSLEKGNIDLAFISPLAYARIKENVKLHPGFLHYSMEGGNYPALFFRAALREIEEIRYPAAYSGHFYQIISRIVCNEFLNLQAEWVEYSGMDNDIKKLLSDYPVVWTPDIKTIISDSSIENYIDLSEIWSDHTELPFIYSVLGISDKFSNVDVLDSIGQIFLPGNQTLISIFDELFTAKLSTQLIYKFQFSAFKEIWEALEEILKFLFYYNEAEYIPELKFYK
ncbi:MAG: hypothetical protein Kow0037_03920 [Calditrichia bacterium]